MFSFLKSKDFLGFISNYQISGDLSNIERLLKNNLSFLPKNKIWLKVFYETRKNNEIDIDLVKNIGVAGISLDYKNQLINSKSLNYFLEKFNKSENIVAVNNGNYSIHKLHKSAKIISVNLE